jgi:hypothetical protein
VGNQKFWSTKFSASRLVLTAQSKFLAALFDGGLKDSNSDVKEVEPMYLRSSLTSYVIDFIGSQ